MANKSFTYYFLTNQHTWNCVYNKEFNYLYKANIKNILIELKLQIFKFV